MMKIKQFLLVLFSVVSVSVVLLFFGENKPDAIQNIVSSTHQQIRSFKVRNQKLALSFKIVCFCMQILFISKLIRRECSTGYCPKWTEHDLMFDILIDMDSIF